MTTLAAHSDEKTTISPSSPAVYADPRDRFIHEVTRGRSFAEVGGLWGTVSEKVSVAHAAGATSLAMIDITTPGGTLWQLFEARCRDLSLPSVRTISGDVVQLAAADASLRFDVVHCAGVLYHIPDPFRLLRALRTITTGHLILTSSITETHIANRAGELRIPDGSALLVPALSEAERAVLAEHWREVIGDAVFGIPRSVTPWNLDDFGPWWWLPTTPALARMCEVAGFDVLGIEHFWGGHAATLKLAVRG